MDYTTGAYIHHCLHGIYGDIAVHDTVMQQSPQI